MRTFYPPKGGIPPSPPPPPPSDWSQVDIEPGISKQTTHAGRAPWRCKGNNTAGFGGDSCCIEKIYLFLLTLLEYE